MLIGASRARSGAYRIILQLGKMQLRLLVLRHRQSDLPEIVVNDSTPLSKISFTEALAQFSHSYDKLGLKQAPVTLVLATGQYQAVSVDRPDVPEQDIAASLAFQLGELVDLAPEDMVTDYYELAYQPSGQNKVVAVVGNKPQLTDWVQAIIDAEWEPEVISISELELRKLHSPSARANLCVYPLERGYLVQIYHQGKLCFSRALNGLASINDYSKEEIELGALEPLATELQRSMDYYESQLRQAPVKEIMLAISHPQLDAVSKALSDLLAVPVTRFTYEDWMNELCEGDFTDLIAFAAAKPEPTAGQEQGT